MTKIPLNVDDLNDDGASYLLEQLYGLSENCISSWASMGATIERHKVSVEYDDATSEWTSALTVQDESVFSGGCNPRLAAARSLIKKAILEGPENSFVLRLPLRVAFQVGLPRESLVLDVLRLSGSITDEEQRVELEIRAE